MKNNKLLSFVITLAFAFVSMFACFPGVTAQATTINITEADYENASTVLKQLCPDFSLDDTQVSSDAKPTTRAEFVAAVTMVLNIPIAAVSDTGFSDVAADHPYAAHISYAAGLGLISNVDLFYPDSPVTYAQAIKIVMSAAGYGVKAEYTGGFPTGYLKAANDAGVGLELGNESTLSHQDAIALVFEACTTDMMEATSFGESYEYTITEGKNILSTYHKVFMAEGVVEANEYTSLQSMAAATGDASIKINGKTFKGEGYQNLIGKKARVLYDTENKNSIIYAYELDNTINKYSELDTLTITGLNLVVAPYDADKDVRYSLESDYSVIYNGKYYGAADYNTVVNPVAGTVELIDNDDNNSIDVIVVKEYQYSVVSGVNEFEEKIYDKYKSNGMVDLGVGGVKYFITEDDGTPLTIDELGADDVVGYAISKDMKLYEIVRYSERIGGTFEAKTNDGKIVVKGEEYKLSDYYVNNVKSLADLKLGMEVILHFGEAKQVVYIEEFSTALKYALYVNAGQNSGLNGNYIIRLYSQDGTMQEIPLADKVKINGGSPQSAALAYSAISAIGSEDLIMRVIKYSLNADGEINGVFSTELNSEGSDVLLRENLSEARPVLYSDNLEVSAGQTLFYKGGVFYPYFAASASCLIMKVPMTDTFKDDEKYYSMSSTTELEDYGDSDSENVRCFGYDVDKNGAAFILWTIDAGGSTEMGGEPASAVVESITTGLNHEGEEVIVAKIFRSNVWDKYYSTDDTKAILASLKPGDIIGFSANTDKEITAVEKHFSYASGKEFYFPRATYNTDGSIKNEGTVGPVSAAGLSGKAVGYVGGYAYTFSGGRASIVRADRNNTYKDINKIVEVSNDPGQSFGSTDIYPITMTLSRTVFVKFINDRSTGKTISAEVYKEADLSSLESYFSAGTEADYIVSRERYHSVYNNFVYVNEYVN